jgi:hypothetical protein
MSGAVKTDCIVCSDINVDGSEKIVINPRTKRKIKRNGPVFKQLVKQGIFKCLCEKNIKIPSLIVILTMKGLYGDVISIIFSFVRKCVKCYKDNCQLNQQLCCQCFDKRNKNNKYPKVIVNQATFSHKVVNCAPDRTGYCPTCQEKYYEKNARWIYLESEYVGFSRRD